MNSSQDKIPSMFDEQPDGGQRAAGEVSPPKLFDFSFRGRYGRLNYINASLILGFAAFVMYMLGFLLIIKISPAFFMVYTVILSVIMGIFAIKITILRLHDMNKSGIWVLFIIIIGALSGFATMNPYNPNYSIISGLAALIELVFAIVLLVFPGTKGPNRFGPQSIRGPIIGLFIFIICIVLGIFGIMFAMQDFRFYY